MATEGEPTDLIKVLHLLTLSFTWGMQVWVSFIGGKRSANMKPNLQHTENISVSTPSLICVPAGFVLVRQVTRHTFGLVQSKLFPVYFYCLLGSNVVSLAVFAVYHPRELLDWHESVQVEYHIHNLWLVRKSIVVQNVDSCSLANNNVVLFLSSYRC